MVQASCPTISDAGFEPEIELYIMKTGINLPARSYNTRHTAEPVFSRCSVLHLRKEMSVASKTYQMFIGGRWATLFSGVEGSGYLRFGGQGVRSFLAKQSPISCQGLLRQEHLRNDSA